MRPLLIIFIISVSACKSVQHVANIEASKLQVEQNIVQEDPELVQLIAPYKDSLDILMEEIIGNLPQDLIKTRPNSNLGNWFTDILHEAGQDLYNKEIDFAIQNYGGIRIPTLNKGPLKVGDIYELMPFDNTLVLLKCDSSSVQKLCNHMAASNGWPISKGLNFSIENQAAANILIDEAPLNSTAEYYILVPDYIANGGDKCYFLQDLPREDAGQMLRELVIDHLRDNTTKNIQTPINNEVRIH